MDNFAFGTSNLSGIIYQVQFKFRRAPPLMVKKKYESKIKSPLM